MKGKRMEEAQQRTDMKKGNKKKKKKGQQRGHVTFQVAVRYGR